MLRINFGIVNKIQIQKFKNTFKVEQPNENYPSKSRTADCSAAMFKPVI